MGQKIGYARVSTRDQKLHLQMDALGEAGCDLIFSDHGVSGGKRVRPGLDKALDALSEGDTLVVYKLCRLARSVKHLTDMMTDFQERGIHFHSLSEGLDTSTPSGRLTFHIFASVAEFQRDLIRENTINGLEAARARGKVLGRPKKTGLLTENVC